MATYTVMKLDDTTKFPRPFNRASSKGELAEILIYYRSYEANKHHGHAKASREAAKRAEEANETPEAFISANNIDTDNPVLVIGKTKFYVFSEQ